MFCLGAIVTSLPWERNVRGCVIDLTVHSEGTMDQSQFATLTGEEIVIAKSAIRIIRIFTAIGTALAIPMVILFALPVLSYVLVAAVIVSPALVGYTLLTAAP
jgi:hypothetical protein